MFTSRVVWVHSAGACTGSLAFNILGSHLSEDHLLMGPGAAASRRKRFLTTKNNNITAQTIQQVAPCNVD
jgi:hypothetical protein